MSAVVELGFSAPAVFTGIDRVEKRLSGLDQNVQNFGNRLSAVLGGVSLAGAASYLKNTANEMSALVDTADRLRSTPETIQRVTKAAEILGGTDLETLSGSLDKLARELVSQPDSGLAQSLRDLGFSAQAYLQADVDEKLFLLADAFAEAQRRGTALPLLTDALGKSFSKLIPTLQTGRGELKAFMDGTAVIGNSAVMNIDQINDRFDIMNGKIMTAAKVLALGVGVGLAEMVGLKERTQVNPDGGAAKNAELEAAQTAKRNAEAAAALKEAERQRAEKTRTEQSAAADEAFEKAERLAGLQARLDEDRRRAGLEEMDLGKRIATLRVMVTDSLEWEKALRRDFVPDAEKIIAAESQTLSLQKELNAALREHARTKEQAAQTAKREADEAARANEQRKQAVMSTAQEFKLLEARATGRKRAIEDAEREVAIEQRRDRLMRDNGLNRAEATALATRMQNLQERADNGGRATRIRGVQSERRMSGLSDFYTLQRGPSAFDRLQQSESAFDKLQRTPSAFDQLQQRAAQDRLGPQNARNATEPTPARPIDANEAVNRILTLLPQAMADALTKN